MNSARLLTPPSNPQSSKVKLPGVHSGIRAFLLGPTLTDPAFSDVAKEARAESIYSWN
jgi:hypothetical protein